MKAKIDIKNPYSGMPYIMLMNEFGKDLQTLLGVDDATLQKIKFKVNNTILEVVEEWERK